MNPTLRVQIRPAGKDNFVLPRIQPRHFRSQLPDHRALYVRNAIAKVTFRRGKKFQDIGVMRQEIGMLLEIGSDPRIGQIVIAGVS